MGIAGLALFLGIWGGAPNVVDDGCPHVGAEDFAGVEKLTEQVIQAVEEELRQTQKREEDREVTDVLGVARGRDDDEQGREHHRDEGDDEQDRASERQQAVHVGVTVVTSLDRADDLGN